MTRLTVLMIAIASLAAGAVAAGWLLEPAPRASRPTDARPASPGRSAPLEARIEALERALSVEREARQLLQEEVIVLSEAVAATADSENVLPSGAADAAEPSTDTRFAESAGQRRRQRSTDPDGRRERMIENGFTAAEAERILQRESELRMEALQARYEAQRSGEPFDFRNTTSALRDELGDDAYARYLAANGRPASVTVSSVFEGSPAIAAGLRPGDEILRYDGRRVFNMNDISDLTLQGAAGENVVVDIRRDGIAMQLSVPRGPLGVTGGRRFRR
jgi:C-terminal processing protease CtpA/Prc